MSHIRSVNTAPELALRRALWRNGFRYRIHVKNLPGSPDIVLPKYHSIVFVHGCFWHGHRGCSVYHIPQTNTEYWRSKVERNQSRDQEVWRRLEAKGWAVILVWECQLSKEKFGDTLNRVISEIRANREEYNLQQEDRREERSRWNREQKASKARKLLLLKELNTILNH